MDRPYLGHLGHHLRLHAFTNGFYTLRFLLGVAEAPFFAGVPHPAIPTLLPVPRPSDGTDLLEPANGDAFRHGGIALFNALGNLGFFGPYAFGLIKDATGGSFTYGLMVLALGPIVSAPIVLALGHDRRLEHIPGRDVSARR